ncbi:MAG: S41 family peptidase [Bacteroidales bacterium]|nr:S41 family peptidase [Bacteroidales bacterium]
MKRYILVLCTALLSVSVPAQKTPEIEKSLNIYNDVMRQLDINYADTIDVEDLVTTSIHQMLRKIDPYTVYIPKDKTNDLRFMTTGKYGGIGAVIMQRGDTVCINNPYEGMPAQLSDVRAGDKILEVNGVRVIKKTTAEVSDLLRGVPDSKITIKLKRDGEKKPLVKTFERQEIKISPIAYSTALNDSVGYIAFTEFTEKSAKEFKNALDELVAHHGTHSLILDLRSNGGGIIDEAIKIVNLFVDKGTEIVATKGKTANSHRTYKTTQQPSYPDMPLVVLVDHNSASAAEIVSGALQDLDRALIIGQRTYGKGLVQSIRPIAYDGNLKVTTAKYYIPSGRCIQAIDYSKRRSDGSVEQVPDSLRKEFKTLRGRTVRDGGGIEPDIILSDSSKVGITYSLYVKQMFFDYATRYRREHERIAPPTEFQVTDSILEDFMNFLDEQEFTYQTETSKYYEDMLRMAHNELLDSMVIKTLEDLQDKITPSFRDAIAAQKEEVKLMLGQEIVRRYYFQKGEAAYSLRFDKEVERALEEIVNLTMEYLRR